jgi:uncharacterized protein YbjT (DUF2867 family)
MKINQILEEFVMTRVLVTGGTGMLGRELVPKLKEAGYTVRIMSRKSQPATLQAGMEWAQAEVETGQGLAEAVANVDVIVHAASNPRQRTREVEIEGTRNLLEKAKQANLSHFIYVSIVGIDRIPFPYYKHKLETEQVVKGGDVPWSILRATQFYPFIDFLLQLAFRPPIGLLPSDFQSQPIDTGEVADNLVEIAGAKPGGLLPDLCGPEVLRMSNALPAWRKARGVKKPYIHLPLPGKIAHGFRNGYNTCPQNRQGKITWAQWLEAHSAAKY